MALEVRPIDDPVRNEERLFGGDIVWWLLLLIVSVAAGRTQADVDKFMATETPGWRSGWHWLLGPDEAALKLTWAHWHIAVIPTAGDINHDAVLNIIDPSGSLRAVYPAPLPIDDVVHAITTIAHA